MSFQFVQLSEKARQIIVDHVNQLMTENEKIGLEDTTIVWHCKVLGNWKALVITNLQDEQYYEITYNGVQSETYLDVYSKVHNEVIKD